MDPSLTKLKGFVKANPKRALFNPPASTKVVAGLEKSIGLKLPELHREFLRAFDGGFINVSGITLDAKKSKLKDAAWNSNHLLPVKEIAKEYQQWASIGADVFGFEGTWPYVPFMRTSNQELLVFGPAKKGKEQPVLDAFHEIPPEEWAQLFPSFTALLKAYTANEGKLDTVAG